MSLNLPQNSASEQQREVLDALPVLVFLERAGKIVYANAEARLMLGLQEGEAIQRPVEDVLWGLFPGTAEPQTQLAGSNKASPFHATLLARNGRMQPIEGSYCVVNAELREAIIVAHPGARERAPRSRLLEDVLASIPEAVVIVHEDHLLYTNTAFTSLFGYTLDEVSGANLRDFIVPETRLHEIAMISQGVEQHGSVFMETVRKTKSGDLVDVALLAGPLVVNGIKVGLAISYRDIGERKQVEARLQHDAMHDVLTGLPNRALFLDRLSQAFSRRARRRDLGCGVLFIDLDGFKEVNNSLGHAAGDLLLVNCAARLRGIVRPQDTPARLGGDEFAVLVEGVLGVADLETVAGRISRELENPYSIYGNSMHVGASIGLALAGPDHGNPESLVRDADYAMYRAKQGGGSRIEVFDRRLEIHLTAQQERELELRQMLEQRRFETWYEPIYRLSDGRLEGFESVLRFARPDGSLDNFRDLLALAEETGLSITIGRESADAVCGQLAQWRDDAPDLTVSVNLSSRQFYHPELIAQWMKILSATGVDPSRLLFEVAENTLVENPDAAAAILQRLTEMNVRIAVDDFGCSLAPVNYLLRLPIDVVKLDTKLTLTVTRGGRQMAMLESLIYLGRSLNVRIVAQAIELQEQLDALRQLGCEFGQGSLLSAPVDAAEARRLAGPAYRSQAPVA
jgi:diguanylate cyclase (GGDEF)-like protein/PAS domain S-box-containing protein